MSKLSDLIQAKQTDQRKAVMEPLISLDFTSAAIPSDRYSPMYYVYELTANFGCTATLQQGSGETQAALKKMRRQVIETVFGEFREDIHAIERALFDYDTKAATEALEVMYHRMFDV